MISFKAAGSTLLMMTTLWLICREPNKKVQIYVILIQKTDSKSGGNGVFWRFRFGRRFLRLAQTLA
jgi:hypothetical protein